jgi:hypothetical protein
MMPSFETNAKNVAREALCFPTTSRILEYAFAMIVHLASKGSFFDMIIENLKHCFAAFVEKYASNRLWKYQQPPFEA